MTIDERYEQGFGYRAEGRYAEAKAAFEDVLARSPGHTKSLWQLALIQGFEGDFDGSLASLQSLAFEHPADLDIRNDLAMTYMMLGFVEEACAEFQAVLMMDPTHENARRQSVYC